MNTTQTQAIAPLKSTTLRSGALFVDFENVFFALLNGSYRLIRDAALSASLEAIAAVRERLRGDGVALVVERSYADWEQIPATAQRQLQIAGVLPRFTDSRRDKNTADIELSLDVLEQLLTRGDLTHVAIVGGDRDYLPVLRRLKEHRRRITVCSLKDCLSGDIREFLGNYVEAEVVDLDSLLDLAAYRTGPPSRPTPSRPTATQPAPSEQAATNERHERYIAAMMRFMAEKGFKEIHLGPFFRWLRGEGEFNLLSSAQQRRAFDELVAAGALTIEDRDSGQGYSYSIARLNWNHELVRRLNQVA